LRVMRQPELQRTVRALLYRHRRSRTEDYRMADIFECCAFRTRCRSSELRLLPTGYRIQKTIHQYTCQCVVGGTRVPVYDSERSNEKG